MSLPRRRDVLASTGASASAIAGCLDLGILSGSPASGSDGDAPTVALETVADGFGAPVAVAFRPGDDRPYVADQPGTVYRVDDDGPSPVADLSERMVSIGSGYTESGLLGLEFHPEGDRAYVRYSAPPREGTPSEYDHTFVLDELPVTADGALAVDDERTLLEIPEPQPNHNAGDLAFGPDGLLYVAVGDGGGGGDVGTGHVDDWYDANDGGNGQDVTENLLGSVLRIDIDSRTDGKPYGIPDDNPHVDAPGLPEHYAWGFRNPWRLSFDDDRLIVADVGQSQYEEVNVVEKGGNYGWNVREGRHCYSASDCPTETPDGDPLREPVLEYSHDVGIAVVGGHVYRGNAVPVLQGQYVFGDWRKRLFVADPTGETWTREDLPVAGGFDRYVLAFGTDHDDELYVLTDADSGPGGDAGRLSRFAPTNAGDSTETTSDGTGPTSDGTGDHGTTARDVTGTALTTPMGGDEGTETDAPGGGTADATGGSPGFGALAALVGVGGTVARRFRRRTRG